ncbi:MAG TPA: CCA tRNA nucleotidyltransferase [Xanthobacteraceae bacterium]|nr:CCA tRNA nucleotidyltransferase [Xanthobacteraceae bacterium]
MTDGAALGHATWLQDAATARLLGLLNRDGEEARVVGGAVRNELMRLPVDEIDVATTALPDEVVRRVEASGLKAVPTGIAHGTVTVVVDGKPFEVTTLREDVETFGRKAKVAFGRDWKADAERRDFTVNGLSASADGKVYDYVGGLADIAARRVRFIGEPDKRIAEDYLRILRFFRFHAYFGEGAPDPAGLLACIRARAGLETLSRERVRMELLKLLIAPRATPTLAVMAECGLLGMAIGGVPYMASFENMVKVEAASGAQPDAVRRLGALNVQIAEDAARLAEKLRLFNVESERLAALDGWWRVSPAAGEQAGHALLYHLGPQSFVDRVLVAWSHSDAGATDRAWRELATLPQRWPVPVFPLKAADFFSRGVPKGPAMGAALRTAEAAWIAADFPTDRVAIEAIAERAAQQNKISN